ncbi:MAG: hypothetical protein KY392_01080 [Chloroflexi bacterium]|nr:hypothetical protein [Chloroflexota bacterium]
MITHEATMSAHCSAQRSRRAARATLFACALVLALAGQAQAAPGDLDSSFSGDGRQTTDFAGGVDLGNAMAVQADGKIVVAGSAPQSATPGSDSDFALARYNADGSLDSSFSDGGKQTTDFGGDDAGRAVAVQADGKIVVAGSSDYDFALARYNPDGTLDSSFSGGGKQTTDFAGIDAGRAMALQADGKIVVAGSTDDDFALARYDVDGSLDSSFGNGGKQTTRFGGWGRAVAVQADGKIVVAGSSYQGVATGDDFALARYNTDGSLDSSFSGDGKQTTDFSGNGDYGNGVAVQADGKVVVVGGAYDDHALARYDADGSLDHSFSGDGRQTTDFGSRDFATAVAVQADAKIVVAGFNPGDFTLARYNADGSLDSSFSGDGKQTTDFGGLDSAGAVAVQADGKIVVAGSSGAATGFDYDFALARYEGGAAGSESPPDPDPAPNPPAPVVPPPPPPSVGPCGTEGAAGYLYPAKMRVLRSRVLREDRRLDVLAPITSRARGGDVEVTFQADGRTDRFDAEVTEGGGALDQVRFKEPIRRGQARLATGIVTLNYLGDEDTRAEEVRLRAASQRAELDVEEIGLVGDRLSGRGSVSSRAEGVVRLRYSYLDEAGTPQVHLARATIQDDGDWVVDAGETVPPRLARCGGYLSILFTGYFERRIRGEMLAYQLDAGQTRRP